MLHDLGQLQYKLGRYAEAEALVRSALDIRSRCFGVDAAHPDVAESHRCAVLAVSLPSHEAFILLQPHTC